LKTNHAKLLDTIKTTGDLTKASDDELKAILDAFLPESGLVFKAWETWKLLLLEYVEVRLYALHSSIYKVLSLRDKFFYVTW